MERFMKKKDDEIEIEKATYDFLMRLTKDQLIQRFCQATRIANSAKSELESMQTKLDKAEAYVEQGRAMINAVMERWYEYDA
jgi:multidrug resistance efflux pump